MDDRKEDASSGSRRKVKLDRSKIFRCSTTTATSSNTATFSNASTSSNTATFSNASTSSNAVPEIPAAKLAEIPPVAENDSQAAETVSKYASMKCGEEGGDSSSITFEVVEDGTPAQEVVSFEWANQSQLDDTQTEVELEFVRDEQDDAAGAMDDVELMEDESFLKEDTQNFVEMDDESGVDAVVELDTNEIFPIEESKAHLKAEEDSVVVKESEAFEECDIIAKSEIIEEPEVTNDAGITEECDVVENFKMEDSRVIGDSNVAEESKVIPKPKVIEESNAIIISKSEVISQVEVIEESNVVKSKEQVSDLIQSEVEGESSGKCVEISIDGDELPLEYREINEPKTDAVATGVLTMEAKDDKDVLADEPDCLLEAARFDVDESEISMDDGVRREKTPEVEESAVEFVESVPKKRGRKKRNVAGGVGVEPGGKRILPKKSEYTLRNRTVKPEDKEATQTLPPLVVAVEEGGGKVPAIKLKIAKTSPLENLPPSITITKVEPPTAESSRQSTPDRDRERVERFLKDADITITPITPSPSQSSILMQSLSRTSPFAQEDASYSYYESGGGGGSSGGGDVATAFAEERRNFWQSGSSGVEIMPVRSDAFDVRGEIRRKLAMDEMRKKDAVAAEEAGKKVKAMPELKPIFSVPQESMFATPPSYSMSHPFMQFPRREQEMDFWMKPQRGRGSGRRGRPPKTFVMAREAAQRAEMRCEEDARDAFSGQSMEECPVADGNFKIFGKEVLEKMHDQRRGEDSPVGFHTPLFDMTEASMEDDGGRPSGRYKRRKEVDEMGEPVKSKRGRKRKVIVEMEEDDDITLDMEELKRLEEERLRKEEDRKRRDDMRKLKAKERNEKAKMKRLRQKQRSDERQLRLKERKRLLQEEKKKLEDQLRNLPPSSAFDDETRMSMDNSQQETSFNTTAGIPTELDESCSAATNDSQKKRSRLEINDDSNLFQVENISEYQWPIQGGELYMIQEQICNFLNVKSFKRRYPDLRRRAVDSEERAYLVDSGLVSESLCEMGLTAVHSTEILDIMFTDFPDKYEELRRHMREKQAKELSFKQKAWANGLGYKLLMADGMKQDTKKRAMESASNWNSALNKSRSDNRRCSLDLQTFIVHYPQGKRNKMTIPTGKMGSYPLAILPGQFCDYYKSYTPTELRYMPVNTVLYGPMRQQQQQLQQQNGDEPEEEAQSQSDSEEDSSSSDESSGESTDGTQGTAEDATDDVATTAVATSAAVPSKDERCKICDKPEGTDMLKCSRCFAFGHASCMNLSPEMMGNLRGYKWQCADCKICLKCGKESGDKDMLCCDSCDRGYHNYCLGLKTIPTGRWQCPGCMSCDVCGSKQSDSGNADSQWFYEYKKTENGGKRFSKTMCADCYNVKKEQSNV